MSNFIVPTEVHFAMFLYDKQHICSYMLQVVSFDIEPVYDAYNI